MAHEIVAPIAGKVVRLEIEVGIKVEEDDVALILEAMKMETPIYVSCEGTVKEIKVKEGDMVEDGDILVILA